MLYVAPRHLNGSIRELFYGDVAYFVPSILMLSRPSFQGVRLIPIDLKRGLQVLYVTSLAYSYSPRLITKKPEPKCMFKWFAKIKFSRLTCPCDFVEFMDRKSTTIS